MQRDIGLIAHDPAVVPGRDVEDIARAHLDHLAVIHRRRGLAGDDHPDMLDLARRLAKRGADMLGPFPARLISCAADSHPADMDELEASEIELADLVGLLEALEDDVEIHQSN